MDDKKKTHSFPGEVVDFFGGTGGRSLLIKGRAGTGKTTFALQLMEELAEPDRSFYLSTRVSDEALYNQFPWLKDKEMQGQVIDSGRVLLNTLIGGMGDDDEIEEEALPEEDQARINVARQFLDSITEEEMGPPTTVDRTNLKALVENNPMPEVERIYERVEFCLPEKTLFIVDSIEGITHKYGVEPEDLITTLQKDLVENSNTNLILVLEKAEAPDLEYLVDGVIDLVRAKKEERRIRGMTLEKLRATEIKQPEYLLTLQFGRFRCFEPFETDYTSTGKWEPVADCEGKYSTGIKDIDKLLDGGFRRGSYNVIEVDQNVSSPEYNTILRPIIWNFITQGRGIVAVLTGGSHPERMREDFVRFVDPAIFDDRVRIADYFVSHTDKPYIMSLGTRNKEEALRIWKDNLGHLRGPDNAPMIDYTGFDTLEYLRGDTIAIKDLLNAVAKTKNSKDLGLGVIKPGLKLTQEIMNMADTYFKIIVINRCPCIFGVKPKTIIYAITMDETLGYPHVSLTPIV